jgi:succinylglutamate desuccinylase
MTLLLNDENKKVANVFDTNQIDNTHKIDKQLPQWISTHTHDTNHLKNTRAWQHGS